MAGHERRQRIRTRFNLLAFGDRQPFHGFGAVTIPPLIRLLDGEEVVVRRKCSVLDFNGPIRGKVDDRIRIRTLVVEAKNRVPQPIKIAQLVQHRIEVVGADIQELHLE